MPPELDNITLANLIYFKRRGKRVNQTRAADEAGINRARMSQIERGTGGKQITLNTMIALCDYLAIPYDVFVACYKKEQPNG